MNGFRKSDLQGLIATKSFDALDDQGMKQMKSFTQKQQKIFTANSREADKSERVLKDIISHDSAYMFQPIGPQRTPENNLLVITNLRSVSTSVGKLPGCKRCQKLRFGTIKLSSKAAGLVHIKASWMCWRLEIY